MHFARCVFGIENAFESVCFVSVLIVYIYMEPVNYTTQSLEQSNIGVCSRTGLDGMRVI